MWLLQNGINLIPLKAFEAPIKLKINVQTQFNTLQDILTAIQYRSAIVRCSTMHGTENELQRSYTHVFIYCIEHFAINFFHEWKYLKLKL
jgi:hypothetical protein